MEKTIGVAELGERELYQPSPEIAANANVKEYDELYRSSMQDPQAFWARARRRAGVVSALGQGAGRQQPALLQVVRRRQDQHRPQRLDRHLKTFRKNKLALIWEGEPGDVRTFSYFALNRKSASSPTC